MNENKGSNMRAKINKLQTELAALKTRLVVAEGLFERWLWNEHNHVFQNTTLQEDTQDFLAHETVHKLSMDTTGDSLYPFKHRD